MRSWSARRWGPPLGVVLTSVCSACSLLSLDPLGSGADGGGGSPATGASTTSTGADTTTSSTIATATSSAGGGDGGGSSSAGGGGGGPTVPCGGTSVLANRFDDADATLALWNADQGSSDVRIENGEIVIRPPSDGSNPFISFHSRWDYDLRGDAIAARFVETLDPAVTDAASSMVVQSPNGDLVAMRAEEGELRLVTLLDDTFSVRGSLPLDGTAMARWRLRHEDPDVVAETSPDGADWTELGRVAVAELFDLSLVRIAFDARVPGVVDAPGVMRVDDVEGLFQGAAHCPARTLTDDFADGAVSPEWGRSNVQPECGPEESGGQLLFPFVADQSQYCELRTSRLYDLRGDGVVIRMTTQSSSETAEGYLHVEDARDEGAIITANGDGIAAQKRVPERVIVGDGPYVAAEEPWWRIRDDDGTVRFELSADGVTWRTLAESPVWFDSSSVQIAITGGTWDDPTDPGVVTFDDFNLPPP